jgi:DNA modification methylase
MAIGLVAQLNRYDSISYDRIKHKPTNQQRKQMDYNLFLKQKENNVIKSGFDIAESELNKNLFDFQKHIVKKALKHGKYAIFADCGLGKTLMQLEWAYQVSKKESKPSLILAPLAVVQQTIEQGAKFGINVERLKSDVFGQGVYITNYEQIDNFDLGQFVSVAIDEASILKNYSGALKNKIIKRFKNTKYKTAWTATPSPNDHIELGNISEFLDVLSSRKMVSEFFINDIFSKDELLTKSKWRLKSHAEDTFWKWVSMWAVAAATPSDLGYNSQGYNLPSLDFINVEVKTKKQDNGKLFNDNTVTATSFYKQLSQTLEDRANKVLSIVEGSAENFIIWVKTDEDGDYINKMLPNAKQVKGSDKVEYKENTLNGFAKNEFKVLITKAKIAQFGLNYQNCHNQIFMSYDFSFESLYQAVRRSYRFGQKNDVSIYMISLDTMENVNSTLKRKQQQFHEMQTKMVNKMKQEFIDNTASEIIHETDNYKLINDDCIKAMQSLEEESIDYSFFSPPFSDLYMYSSDKRDLSNSADYDQFFSHFEYVCKDLLRILKSGRLVSMHLTQLSTTITNNGYISIVDFRGDIIRMMQKLGYYFHAEVAIRKDPKTIAQRTKAQSLLHGTTKKDSTKVRMAFPDYILTFKKPGENLEPINHEGNGVPFDLWCKIAEPIWMQVDEKKVLSVKQVNKGNDEKHMTPTQLQPIEWLYMLYTNPNDTVFSPFSGIGSEGYQAVKMGRKYIGAELKKNYWETSIENLNLAEHEATNVIDLFS